MSTIFCVGIGGIGLSGLARILHAQGHQVLGSDQSESALIDALRTEGILTSIPHAARNLPADVDRVIYSLAIPHTNPELVEACRRGILVQSYPEAVGELTTYLTVAIAGTHGKTTTTAMTALALEAGKLDPLVLIGSLVPNFGNKNMRFGRGPFVVEACEYKRAFLSYHPDVLVITNTEPDHLDYYKDHADYISAFVQFIGQLKPRGVVILQSDDPGNQELLTYCPDAITVSMRDPSATYFLSPKGEVFYQGNVIARLPQLHVPGVHNRSNALLAFTVGHHFSIAPDLLVSALAQFVGTWRRFEYKGTLNGAPFYDDYGHHPTEISTTLAAAREKFPDRRIVCVFQPHQHSRTRLLWDRFVDSFAAADLLVIPNIYAARDTEEDKAEITAERFVAALQKNHPAVHFGNGLENTAQMLQKMVTPDDVVVIMGAGDVTTLTDLLPLTKKI